MKHSSYFRLAACGLFILGCTFSLAQNSPQPFSSDYTFTAEGSKPSTGKIYFSWPFYRMDTDAMISIVNYKTKTSYTIFRDKRVYFERRARSTPLMLKTRAPNGRISPAKKLDQRRRMGAHATSGRQPINKVDILGTCALTASCISQSVRAMLMGLLLTT